MIEWIECYHIEWGNYTLRNILWVLTSRPTRGPESHFVSANRKRGNCTVGPFFLFTFSAPAIFSKEYLLHTLLIQQRNAFLPGNVFWLILPFFRIPIAWVVTTPGEVALYRTLVQTHSWSQPTWLHCNCYSSSSSPPSHVTLPLVSFICH